MIANTHHQLPTAFLSAIRSALSTGDTLTARAIAADAHRLYPDDPDLARYWRVLAPPVATAVTRPSRPDIRADFDWLRTHHNEYAGRWVALKDGQLLATAESVDGLFAQVGDVRNTGILVTQVYESAVQPV